MKQKIREWIRRYLVAEILSFITTLLGASVAYQLTGDNVATALAAAWAGNISYFGYILVRDVMQTREKNRSYILHYQAKDFFNNIRLLVIDFGVAGIDDSFLV